MNDERFELFEMAVDEQLGAEFRALITESTLSEPEQIACASLCRSAFIAALVFAVSTPRNELEDWLASHGYRITAPTTRKEKRK